MRCPNCMLSQENCSFNKREILATRKGTSGHPCTQSGLETGQGHHRAGRPPKSPKLLFVSRYIIDLSRLLVREVGFKPTTFSLWAGRAARVLRSADTNLRVGASSNPNRRCRPHQLTRRAAPPSRQNLLCCPANPRPGIRTIFCGSDTAVPMRCAVRPWARRIASTRSADASSTT
jgi:hypothetical protein